MKNRLLPLFVVLGSFSAYSQVGVGTKTPNASAQLEVTVKDNDPKKGILIPRVPLKSTTDITTIVKSNDPLQQPYVNSLLVFATEKIGDITPGFYYWFADRWNRMAISGESGSGTGKDGKDGKVGVAEGSGVPAPTGDAAYLGPDINIYTDTAAGNVYVQNADGTWTLINGTNGVDGKSAFEIWKEIPGNESKTQQDFIDSLKGTDGIAGANGADGKDFTYTDFTPEQLAGLKGETGVSGTNGVDGKDFTYTDFTPEQLAGLKGETGVAGTNGIDGKSAFEIWKEIPGNEAKTQQDFIDSLKGTDGIAGANGANGKDFTYTDFTPDQLAGLKGADGINGVDGKDFTYTDFTPEQLAGLKGADGINGVDGKDFTYTDFTPEQLAGLKGETGVAGTNGIDGKSAFEIWKEIPGNESKTQQDFIDSLKGTDGIAGANGADGKDFTYTDFTPEQLAGLKGETGVSGTNGIDGKDFTYTDFTPEQLAGLKGETGVAGTNGIDGKSAFEIWKEIPGNEAKTQQDFIDSLKGTDGIAGANGADGKDFTYTDFTPEQLAGLKGETGASGKDGIGGKTAGGANVIITGEGTDASPYVINASVSQVVDEFTATAAQTNFALTSTPTSLSKMKIYINGVRIAKDAISFNGTTATYKPTSNGAYTLMSGDIVTIDYIK